MLQRTIENGWVTFALNFPTNEDIPQFVHTTVLGVFVDGDSSRHDIVGVGRDETRHWQLRLGLVFVFRRNSVIAGRGIRSDLLVLVVRRRRQ